jgi:hypothetical protein
MSGRWTIRIGDTRLDVRFEVADPGEDPELAGRTDSACASKYGNRASAISRLRFVRRTADSPCGSG